METYGGGVGNLWPRQRGWDNGSWGSTASSRPHVPVIHSKGGKQKGWKNRKERLPSYFGWSPESSLSTVRDLQGQVGGTEADSPACCLPCHPMEYGKETWKRLSYFVRSLFMMEAKPVTRETQNGQCGLTHLLRVQNPPGKLVHCHQGMLRQQRVQPLARCREGATNGPRAPHSPLAPPAPRGQHSAARALGHHLSRPKCRGSANERELEGTAGSTQGPRQAPTVSFVVLKLLEAADGTPWQQERLEGPHGPVGDHHQPVAVLNHHPLLQATARGGQPPRGT